MHAPIVRSIPPLSALRHALLPFQRELLGGQPRQFSTATPRPALLILAGLALVSFGALPSARANATFHGQETRTHGSRADWSSDFGSDYVVGWDVGPDNTHLALDGQGTGSSSGTVNKWYDAGFSLDWAVDVRGGALGHTFSTGATEVPTAGDVEGRVFKYHLYSELGQGASWFTMTEIAATHFFTNDLASAPLYFAIRYALTVVTESQVYVNARISNTPPPGEVTVYPYQGLLGAGTHHFEGVTTGVVNFAQYSQWQTPYDTRALFDTGLQLVNSPPGSGKAEMLVELVYSASPITEFPGSSNSVPDALPMIPVMAAALGGLALVRRRQTA